MYPCSRYILLGDVDILLNCNLSDVYAIRSELIYGLGYSNLTSKGSLRTGEALREEAYLKNSKQQYACQNANTEYLVRLSSRDISVYMEVLCQPQYSSKGRYTLEKKINVFK